MPVGAAPENNFFLIVSHIALKYDYPQLYCLGFITFVAVQSSGYKQRRVLSASYCRLSIGKHKRSWRLLLLSLESAYHLNAQALNSGCCGSPSLFGERNRQSNFGLIPL